MANRQSGGGEARRQHGNTVPLADRFWTKVKSTRNLDACWLWQAQRNRLGYGLIAESRDGRKKQRWVLAHRVAWELATGRTIPAGMVICHRCDVPSCCNPRHLFLGTQLDNVADAIQKGRLMGRPSVLIPALVDRLTIFRAPGYCGIVADLARRYGVGIECIRHIRAGRFAGSPKQSMQSVAPQSQQPLRADNPLDRVFERVPHVVIPSFRLGGEVR